MRGALRSALARWQSQVLICTCVQVKLVNWVTEYLIRSGLSEARWWREGCRKSANCPRSVSICTFVPVKPGVVHPESLHLPTRLCGWKTSPFALDMRARDWYAYLGVSIFNLVLVKPVKWVPRSVASLADIHIYGCQFLYQCPLKASKVST